MFEEPATIRTQADDAYVAHKEKQHAMMARAQEAAAKRAAESKDDDGWGNWDASAPSATQLA